MNFQKRIVFATLLAQSFFAVASLESVRSRKLQACAAGGTDICGRRFCVEATTSRGFACGECRPGYVERVDPNDQSLTFCDDIDECMEGTPCDSNAVCSDADPPQFFNCECNDGYEGSGIGEGSCTDIDECALGGIDCGANADCVNTPGSFECICLTGFVNVVGVGCVAIVAGTPATPAPVVAAPAPTPASFSLDFCNPLDAEDVLLTEEFEGSSTLGWENGRLSGRGAAFAPFTQFLGPFLQGDAFPTRRYQFDVFRVASLEYSFQFIEGDSWDPSGAQGTDRFLMTVEGDGGQLEVINFGTFGQLRDESSQPTSGTSSTGIISWRRQSAPPSNIGGSTSFLDQIHTFALMIPPTFITDGDIVVTFLWTLGGSTDEFVGIDNIKIVRCFDTVPSSAPSVSLVPTESPQPTVSESPSQAPSVSDMPSVSDFPSATPIIF